MRTDEGNEADPSGGPSQPSESRGSPEGVRVSSSLPVASGGKYPPASSGRVVPNSLADDRPPEPDWLLGTPHVRLRRKAEEQMHNNQFAKAVETFRESLEAARGVQGMHWEMLYDCRYQMIICLLEMERHEDCVREAQTNLDLCLGHINPNSNASSGSDGLDDRRRLLEARSMLGDLLLLSGREDEAKEVLRAAIRTDVPCTNTKLSYIVSLCGGLDDTQPVETCSLAFSQLQGLVSSPDRRFDSVVDRAKAGCMEEFQAALRTFLLNLDQDVPLPRVQRALFVALGSQTGARGWRAAAKLICQSLVEYEVNQQRVSEHCRPQLEAVRLRLDSSLQPLKSFQEFKDLVESILEKPSALQQACPGMHAMCTKLCKAKLKELCRIAEVSML
ncbi:hypothetical protein FOZ63_034129 [Perkinsus olseni]|uniref:Uncharacterized protein n=1 Tax=Perkinsus olseni TaxID=32597 RepID=A0A7J6RSY9_PEROL|nr:hypothetical protein FOZ63_034129 [Perkinsus olseni]